MSSGKRLALDVIWNPKKSIGPTTDKLDSDDSVRLCGYVVKECPEQFDRETGIYTVDVDGLYLISVEVKPSKKAVKVGNGKDPLSGLVLAVKVESDSDEDEFLDFGGIRTGSMVHMSRGSQVYLQGTSPVLSRFRLQVELVQRKRKPPVDDDGNAKKKKGKRKHKDGDSSGEGSDAWNQGFESDDV